MLAWGVAPGIRLLNTSSAESAPSIPRWFSGPNIVPVEITAVLSGAKDRNEITAKLNRAFSAGAFWIT
jgi:hypothetical protein